MNYFEITEKEIDTILDTARSVIFLELFLVVWSKPQLYIMKYIWFCLPPNLEYIAKETV